MLATLVFIVIIVLALMIALPFLAFGFALLIKSFFFCAICFVIGYLVGRSQ